MNAVWYTPKVCQSELKMGSTTNQLQATGKFSTAAFLARNLRFSRTAFLKTQMRHKQLQNTQIAASKLMRCAISIFEARDSDDDHITNRNKRAENKPKSVVQDLVCPHTRHRA